MFHTGGAFASLAVLRTAVHGGTNVNVTSKTEKRETPASEIVARLPVRTEKRNPAVLPQLRHLLDESPALWRGYSDLTLQA